MANRPHSRAREPLRIRHIGVTSDDRGLSTSFLILFAGCRVWGNQYA